MDVPQWCLVSSCTQSGISTWKLWCQFIQNHTTIHQFKSTKNAIDNKTELICFINQNFKVKSILEGSNFQILGLLPFSRTRNKCNKNKRKWILTKMHTNEQCYIKYIHQIFTSLLNILLLPFQSQSITEY